MLLNFYVIFGHEASVVSYTIDVLYGTVLQLSHDHQTAPGDGYNQ